MAVPAGVKRQIVLLGGAGIQVNEAPLTGRATHRHPLALLALLILSGGRGITRDKLIALLWPERDSDSARNLLKVNVHELRKELGDAAIRSAGDQLSADLGAISCDVADFLAAVSLRDDVAAVASYRGPFLDGFFIKDSPEFEQWVDGERARLAGMYGAALDRLASAAESRGDFESAVKWRRAHAAHDPYHPDVAYRLVNALASSGDRAGAIQFAESFAERQRRDFDLSDEHEIVAVARQLRSSYTPPTPPEAVETEAAHNAQKIADVAPTIGDRPSRRRKAAIWSATVLVAAAAVTSAVLFARGSSRTHETSGTPVSLVAVTPFHMIGGDTAVANGITDLIAARLTGEAGPQALDPRLVTRAWTAASKSGAPSLDHTLQFARELGAGRALTGEIVSASDSTAVAVRLYDAVTGKLVATSRVDVSRATSPASVADRLSIELIARAAGEPDDRIAGLTTRSVSAVRKYIAAQRAYKSARYAAAESLYAQALGADATFGAAGLGLAMANSWTVISESYGIGRDAALRNIQGMSTRDQLFARAFFGPDPALGSPAPAPVYLARWEDLVEKYPDWTEAWYQLGDRYYHFGGLSGLADAIDRARYAFRRALSQDSSFAAPLHHLVEIYAARGELSELRAAETRYFAANPSVNRDRSAIGWEMAVALGDNSWLKRIRANFDSMPREDLSRIVWVTEENGWPDADAERAASLVDRKAGTASEHEKAEILRFAHSLNHGQAQEARVAAAALGTQFPDRPVGALWDLYAALFDDGDSVLAADAANRLQDFARGANSGDHVRRDQHDLAACMLGYYRATRGDIESARSAFDRVTADLRGEDNNFAKRNASVCLAMVSATIAAARHAPDAALQVARLDTILLRERVPPHVILEAGTLVAAKLHAALGDTAAALVAARRREHLTGDPLFLSSELRLEAEFAAAQNDTAGAARARAHLLALRGRF